MNRFLKDLGLLILSIIISVGVLGFFASTASAAESVIKTYLAGALGLPLTSIPNLDEVPGPPDLTMDQQDEILSNIANSAGVVTLVDAILSFEDEIELAKRAYNEAIDEGGHTQDEVDELYAFWQGAIKGGEQTRIQFANAITNARTNQKYLIDQFRALNAQADHVNSVNDAISSSSQGAQDALINQVTSDAAGAQPKPVVPPPPLTDDQIAAGEQASRNASGWLDLQDNADEIPLKEACIEGTVLIDVHPMSCLSDYVFYPVYKMTSFALMGSGWIFDKMLMLSIDNSNNMVVPPFINETWTVVRDFANMVFIFILIYTGVMTIFGETNWRKTILQVVFIALVINFSLFFTKVIIDAGNILALGILGALGTTSISEGLAAGFQPQSFLTAAGQAQEADTAIIIFTVATVVSGYAAYIFFKMALLFMGRLIGFWFLMIVSPIAFVSTTLPKGNKFQEWLDNLINLTFVAPIFLFLIYIIMKVIGANGGILSKFPTAVGANWFEKLLGPVIVATLIIIALKQSLEFAEGMAGKFGKLGADMAGSVMGVAGGVALGAATGGAALAGRSVGGRLAQGLQESGTLQKWATSERAGVFGAATRLAGRQAITLNDKARTGTWDVTGTKLGKDTIGKGAAAFGVKVAGPGAGAKGGFEGAQKRQDQADQDFAKKLKVTDEEKEEIKEAAAAKVPAATAAVTQSTARTQEASKKVAEAAAALEFSKTMGTLDPNLEKILEVAKKEEEAAREALKKDEETLTKLKNTDELIKVEDKRRRDKYSEYVSGGVRAGVQWATGNIAYSHAKAQKSAADIRKKVTKDIEDKEKAKKEVSEMIAALTKEKAEHTEEKPTEKPAEGKADHK